MTIALPLGKERNGSNDSLVTALHFGLKEREASIEPLAIVLPLGKEKKRNTRTNGNSPALRQREEMIKRQIGDIPP